MSTGQLGDFADDPDSVFLDVPANPRWILPLDLVISTAAVVGGFLAARQLGAGTSLAVVVAVIVFGTVGFKLSMFARFGKVPRLTVEEFVAVRRAGSRALAEFRRAHPDLAHVGWSLVARNPEGLVIAAYGSHQGLHSAIEASHTFIVAHEDAALREDRVTSHPRSSLCQRVVRAECVPR